MFFGPCHHARSVAKGSYGGGSKGELVPQRDRNPVMKFRNFSSVMGGFWEKQSTTEGVYFVSRAQGGG